MIRNFLVYRYVLLSKVGKYQLSHLCNADVLVHIPYYTYALDTNYKVGMSVLIDSLTGALLRLDLTVKHEFYVRCLIICYDWELDNFHLNISRIRKEKLYSRHTLSPPSLTLKLF